MPIISPAWGLPGLKSKTLSDIHIGTEREGWRVREMGRENP